MSERRSPCSSADVPAISVVIAVYGDGAALDELVRRTAAVLERVASSWECILVNDGSPKETWSLIQDLAREFKNIRGINLRSNFGQHNALLAGICASRGCTIITLDDDLQHPPEEIHRLLEALEEGVDVVYGKPISPSHGLWRSVASAAVKAGLKSVLGSQIALDVSAYRAFRGSLRPHFVDFRSPYVSIDVLLSWATSHFRAVNVTHEPRRYGTSHYTIWHLLSHTMNLVTGFSVWPLRVASLLGLVFTCFGVFVLTYVLVRYLVSGTSVAGFPFLASTIALFSGAQLFALGVIGEYLARMYLRMMERPPYVIESTVNCEG